jgi:hypothetical protein
MVNTLNNKEPEKGLWNPMEGRRTIFGAPTADVVDAYSIFLEVRHPDHHKQFKARLKVDSDAAHAEAVIFSWMRSWGLGPHVAESTSSGGIDFLCVPEIMNKQPFMIEVTTLNRKAVEHRSGWPDELSETAHFFSMITPNLWSKARIKAPQLADYNFPRVLTICLTHVGASILLGPLAANWLILSEPKIVVPVTLEGPIAPPRTETNLKQSAFLRVQESAIVPIRQSISAILLVSIWEDQLEVVGLLHPAPTVPFEYRTLDEVPFLRLEWPIKEPVIRTEWVIGNPRPMQCHHIKVKMTDSELRGENL